MSDSSAPGGGFANASNAIPRNLNLSATRPNAAQAYAREFRVYPVNGTSFQQNGTIRINIDTSTPGAFLDPQIHFLSFDFTVARSNTDVTEIHKDDGAGNDSTNYTDAANFYRLPNCGANAFIQEFRIYVQGVPIEEIVNYNLVYELMQDLHGIPDTKNFHASNMYYASGYPRARQFVDPYWSNDQPDRLLANDMVTELKLGNTYRCHIQFMSGVLGTLADKMFPALLVAPGSMYIELRLASAGTVVTSYKVKKDTQSNAAHVQMGVGPVATTATEALTVAGGKTFPPTNYYTGQSNYGCLQITSAGLPGSNTVIPPSTPRVRALYPDNITANTCSYTITNVELMLRQIVLTDTAASAIISRAASSDVSIHTNSYRTYGTDAINAMGNASATGTSLQLLIPAKVASANSLFVVFQDPAQLNNTVCDSLKRQSIGLQADGQGCSYQLRIGNELIPQKPIDTPNESLMQLLRTMHDYPNINNTCCFSQLKQTGFNFDDVQTDFSHPLLQYTIPGFLTYERERRPAWTNAGQDEAKTSDFTANTQIWQDWAGHNTSRNYGPSWAPHFYSTFAIGFDLDNFQNNQDVMRSGKYLGNNTVQLLLNKCKVSPVDMDTQTQPATVTYIVGHDVRLSFQAGGVVQSFY